MKMIGNNLILVSVSEMLASTPTINPAESECKERMKFRLEKMERRGGKSDGKWLLRTYEKRSTGFRNDVNLLTTENVAENEGQDQHHDLEKDSDAGGLLLLAGRRPMTIRRRNLILRAHSKFQLDWIQFDSIRFDCSVLHKSEQNSTGQNGLLSTVFRLYDDDSMKWNGMKWNETSLPFSPFNSVSLLSSWTLFNFNTKF